MTALLCDVWSRENAEMVSAQCKRARCARPRITCVKLQAVNHAGRSLVGRRPESSCSELQDWEEWVVLLRWRHWLLRSGPREKGACPEPLFFCVQLIHNKCGFCGRRHAC